MGILVHGVDLLETYSNRRSRREINGKRNIYRESRLSIPGGHDSLSGHDLHDSLIRF